MAGLNVSRHRTKGLEIFVRLPLGHLIRRLGRKNVCALKKGGNETPNDISGVVYANSIQPEPGKPKWSGSFGAAATRSASCRCSVPSIAS